MKNLTHSLVPTSGDRPVSRMLWIGVILLAGATAALAVDLFVAKKINGTWLPGDLRRIFGLSEIFGHGVGVAVIAWCIWRMAPMSRRCLPRLLACALFPGLAVNCLKLCVCRLRPAYFGEHLPESIFKTWIAGVPSVFSTRAEYGSYLSSSFPSGHAATAFGLAIGLSWLYPRGRAPFFTLAALATIQRIAGDAHWLSDTMVGVALAVLIAGYFTSSTRGARALARFEAGGRQVEIALQSRRAA